MQKTNSRQQAQAALLQGRFFKLICGASYRNNDVIEELSCLYARAGAHAIDVAPDPTAVWRAARGVARAAVDPAPLIMISIGSGHDPHFQTLGFDAQACSSCPSCTVGCPFNVVFTAGRPGPGELQNCIGCGHCLPQCRYDTLSLLPVSRSLDDYRQAIAACRAAGASALEIHTTGDWEELTRYYDMAQEFAPWDLLAFSLTVTPAATPALAARVVALAGAGIVLQLDGRPISGRAGRASTLATLELVRAVAPLDLPAFLQASGGTNDQTGLLARELGLPLNGVAMGSFARTALQEKGESAQLARAVRLVESVCPAPESGNDYEKERENRVFAYES